MKRTLKELEEQIRTCKRQGCWSEELCSSCRKALAEIRKRTKKY